MNNSLPETHRRLIIGYPLSILLVLFYLNMFPVVTFVVQNWGTTPVLVLPILITIAALAAIMLIFLKFRRLNQHQVRIKAILLGTAICLIALAVPDPLAPVKRIHVIEYMVLSLLVRYTMSIRHQGLVLLFFSIFFASLLGIHDEMLQGLHPLRTYGVRDIIVNGLGAAGGGLIWHGLVLFEQPEAPGFPQFHLAKYTYCYLACLGCSVIVFFVPLYSFREQPLPIWPAAPLIISLLLYITTAKKMVPELRHGTRAVSYASFTLLIYLAAARFIPGQFF